jgi:hypothetical protein
MDEFRRDRQGRPSWFGQAFFGRKDGFGTKLSEAIQLIWPNWQTGIFTGDNLFTFGKNLSFLSDHAFMAAVERHAESSVERSIIWRTAVLCWAARIGLRHDGDFVECGCFRGTSARIIYDAVGLDSQAARTFWLYDLFEFPPERNLPADLFQRTRQKFSDCENVRVIKGSVPSVLREQAPDRIAFLHLDMNNAPAEIGALDELFDRVAPGAPIILDDYGYFGYVEQRDAEREWFARRGYDVLELPTSQGLVIK